MSLIEEFRQRPRQVLIRRLLFQVHLWAGIGVGFYIFAMGLTGSFLVFADEIESALHPELFYVNEALTPAASTSTLIASAHAAWPDRTVTAIYAPEDHRQTYVVYLRKGEEILHAYLNPATAQMVGMTVPSSSLVRWMQNLHFNLLSGRSGRAVNGTGGLLLFLLCATGMVIWWPGIAAWRSSLAVNFSRSWKRIAWETHSAVGFWTAAVLIMWALTGFYFGYAVQVSAFVNRLSPLSQTEPPESAPSQGASPKMDVDELVTKARTISPNATFYGVQLPASKTAAVIVFMARETPPEKRTCDYIYFDQYTGSWLRTWQRGVSHSWGDAMISAVVPLHFGTFGGLIVRWLWVLFGLVPPLMFITGAVMWWNRFAGTWLRSLGASRSSQRERFRPDRVRNNSGVNAS